MTTDPGDLVLDLTCGSGAMPFQAETWGRRWIAIDVAQVSIAIARERLITNTYPYHMLKDSPRGQPSSTTRWSRQSCRQTEGRPSSMRNPPTSTSTTPERLRNRASTPGLRRDPSLRSRRRGTHPAPRQDRQGQQQDPGGVPVHRGVRLSLPLDDPGRTERTSAGRRRGNRPPNYRVHHSRAGGG